MQSCLNSINNLLTSSTSTMNLNSSNTSVDLLILGGGWTYTFLAPLLSKSYSDTISYVATTRDGRDSTIKWSFNPEGTFEQFEELPKAKTVVIVFPIRNLGGSKLLVEGYESLNGKVKWIQLGSTGIYDAGAALDEKKPRPAWTDRHSPYAYDNPRAMAEDELLSLREDAFVLNLSGLWGGTRDPLNWIARVASSKASLATKSSLHLIHGVDVARAIVAVHLSPPSVTSQLTSTKSMNPSAIPPKFLGKRYILTDLRIYDWWDLISSWAAESSQDGGLNPIPKVASAVDLKDHAKWVLELMIEMNVRGLPRTNEQMGRALDSRDFWVDFGLWPIRGRLERVRL